jgi:FAD/FMN-containing dehydrogenase
MFELGDAKLNEDIVVPMRSYVKFARFLEDCARKSPACTIPTFGHLADGNLHVNIMYHRADKPGRRICVRRRPCSQLMETGVAARRRDFGRARHWPGEDAIYATSSIRPRK